MTLDRHRIRSRLRWHLAWRGALASPHRGAVEVAALFGLYGIYEILRGFGELDFATAHRHTEDIVALEQRLRVFGERSVQEWAQSVPGLPTALGFAYIAFHLFLTTGVLVWIYRVHRDRFPARVAGAAYPGVMLFIIVATGNHFLFDAAVGGAVVAIGWLAARLLVATPVSRPTRTSQTRLELKTSGA